MTRVSTALLLAIVGCILGGGCGHASSTVSTHASSTGSSTPGAPAGPTPAGAATAGTQSTSASGDTVVGSSQGVIATLHAANHQPKVGRLWPIQFTVTRAGHPARASVSYEYLFAGQVVARRSHYVFTGHFADTFKWPATAVSYPLTLRAVIVSEGVTINLDFPVQVTA